MEFLIAFERFSLFIFILFTILYAYQLVYIAVGYLKRKPIPLADAKTNHRFAIFISARNEAGVIGELIDSLHKEDYPDDRYDIYVLADNCTDNTAEVARNAGALVYERQNKQLVGKGYALDYLYKNVVEAKGEDYYDAFIVFDADNIVHPDFLKEINKTFDTGKFDAITTYRNSKNFGENWLTAAYSIWFMREARYVNYPRMLLGAQCMISGTGFLVSNRIMKKNGGWPFHLLTEDIQFSVNCAIDEVAIGYCDGAMVYDEQPSTMKQSWNQRLRWSKGFFQLNARYTFDLIKGCFKKGRRLINYDVLMTILPCSLVTIIMLALTIWIYIGATGMPYYVSKVFQDEALRLLMGSVFNYYFGMIAIGGLVILTEWKRINATAWEKIKYLPIFPLFIASYMPITIQAMFSKVEWKPIQHYSTQQLSKTR